MYVYVYFVVCCMINEINDYKVTLSGTVYKEPDNDYIITQTRKYERYFGIYIVPCKHLNFYMTYLV